VVKKIVIDTSALIAVCIYPDRVPADIFKQTLLRYQLVASQATKNEIENVLKRKKFDAWRTLDSRMAWLNAYFQNVEEYVPMQHFTDSVDPKDNMFLDIAVAANASAIVCSDPHLLNLHPFHANGEKVDILNLRDFKALYLPESEH
jgi:putative PIN family toxin of toxin-antitoxin system